MTFARATAATAAALAALMVGPSALAAPQRVKTVAPAAEAPPTTAAPAPGAAATPAPSQAAIFAPETAESEGSVTVGGRRIDYRAVAGTLIVHPKDWDDTAALEQARRPADKDKDAGPAAEASMFYAAYFAKGAPSASRPITFLFNGGPGSASMWLHMGAFGPRRVVTADAARTPAAPYRLVDNAYSLLDVSDLVFVDAPATGFSRIAGKDKEKAFFGIDQDAYAFSQFVTRFMTRFGRWNSPKYIFGESYGTPRAAVMTAMLQGDESLDLNGVIMLSVTLNFDLWADTPQFNPGTEEPYIVTLPTMAATAWYHNRVGGDRPADLQPWLREVEQFALTDYAAALMAGSQLEPARKRAIAERLSRYTGLSVDYLIKADLRVNVGEFQHEFENARGITVGRLDTRFTGPHLDLLGKEADYDPQSAALGSAYVTALNDYVRRELRFGFEKTYRPGFDVGDDWSYNHQPPGAGSPIPGIANVMPDLASAMKRNPNLKLLITGGYFDLATPYFEGVYEARHLQIPAELQSNIDYRYYPSGHMVYANEESLRQIHDDVAAFIRKTDNLGQ
jgi:carboxypeptidase C (cathepsin A)